MLSFTWWALLKAQILVLGVPFYLHVRNPLTPESSSIIPMLSQCPQSMKDSCFQGQRLASLYFQEGMFLFQFVPHPVNLG